MFDVGFWEFAVIGVVALVIVGPERLPGLARTVGAYVGKARRMINDVKADVKRELKENEIADVAEIRKGFNEAASDLKDSVNQVKDQVSDDIGASELKSSLEDTSKELETLNDVTTSSLSGTAAGGKKSTKKKTAKKKASKKKKAGQSSGTKKAPKKKEVTKTAAKKTKAKKVAAKKAVAKKSTARKKSAAKKSVTAKKASGDYTV
ncbi:MAG: Sec-independent protein translocase protein TatB [Pseudomonadota bacterium]